MNDGASVRVSLVAFGNATQDAVLDGLPVGEIYADLSAADGGVDALDLTSAADLKQNLRTCFIGGMKKGAFDVSGSLARSWLRLPNPNGKSNFEIVKPWFNGLDVTRRPADNWIVDFGVNLSANDATLYEAPFSHVSMYVKPQRNIVRNELEKARWWLHARPAPDLRNAVDGLSHMIVSARNGKHRLFVKLPSQVIADGQLVVIARADDATFGILHSRFHELWSLRMCTWLGVGNDPRYTPTTCFETFPFPAGLTPADTAHQRTEQVGVSPHPSPLPKGEGARVGAGAGAGDAAIVPAGLSGTVRTAAENIARAAKCLNDLREHWLNPPEWTQRLPEVIPLGMDASPYPDRIMPKNGHEKELAERTLTKLYNQRPAWLDAAHKMLDAAVAAAYGWADYSADMRDEELLKRLLTLNLQRTKVQNAIK